MHTRDWPVVLTVAGSDSCGGAGIQADLRAFTDHHCHGATAITAITAQNRAGVSRVDLVPPEGLRAQLEAVFADAPIAAVKTGMLATAAHIRVLVEFWDTLDAPPPLVVDPVMVATSGARLLEEDAVALLRDQLVPRATLTTPNLLEAPLLGAPSVPLLITGGDADGAQVLDVLRYPDGREHTWRFPRIGGQHHGTGCTLASAIAARLAQGSDLDSAIDTAIVYVRDRLGGSTA